MSSIAQKKNISSMQVIKTFITMIQGNYQMPELLEKLNSNEPDIVYNNSVVSKYINTCRYCGMLIPKIHNKYIVSYVPFGLELTNKEKDMLYNMQKIVSENMSAKSLNIFKKFLDKITLFSNKKITKIDKNSYETVFENFEQAVMSNRKVKLLFKNRNILECIPVKIVCENGKTFFKVYSDKYKMVDINRLSGIETMPETFVPVNDEIFDVVYKLKPPMSQRYEIRENETELLREQDGSIIISNKNENKEHLISRLLRYDIYCEILKPAILRDEMKQTILSALKNYGE